jgi:hypothetical protein
MKKYLGILAVTAMAASAFAQGTVSFVNGASSLVRAGADLASAQPIPVNGGFVQLLWAPSGTAMTAWDSGNPVSLTAFLAANPGWNAIPESIKAIGPIAAGRFNAGAITVPTAAPGAPIQAAVAAWEGNFATFDAAQAAGAAIGVSSSFAVATGNPTTTPPGTAGSITGAGQFGGVTALAVPEPSSLALAGLGAAALLIFRRRQ